jgi:hypothetical protein
LPSKGQPPLLPVTALSASNSFVPTIPITSSLSTSLGSFFPSAIGVGASDSIVSRSYGQSFDLQQQLQRTLWQINNASLSSQATFPIQQQLAAMGIMGMGNVNGNFLNSVTPSSHIPQSSNDVAVAAFLASCQNPSSTHKSSHSSGDRTLTREEFYALQRKMKSRNHPSSYSPLRKSSLSGSRREYYTHENRHYRHFDLSHRSSRRHEYFRRSPEGYVSSRSSRHLLKEGRKRKHESEEEDSESEREQYERYKALIKEYRLKKRLKESVLAEREAQDEDSPSKSQKKSKKSKKKSKKHKKHKEHKESKKSTKHSDDDNSEVQPSD